MKKVFFLILFLCVLVVNSFAKLVSQKYVSDDKLLKIETKISTSTLLGAIIPYEINLSYSEDILLNDFDIKETLSNFEIKSSYRSNIKKVAFSKYLNQKYYFFLIKFDIGQFIIKGLSINYKLKDKTLNYTLPDILITVNSLIDLNKDKLKDQKLGLIDIKNIENIFPFNIFLFFVIIFLIFFIGFIFYNYFYDLKIKTLEKKLLPHQRAFFRLNKISSLNFKDNIEIKAFYIELSEILREYLETRYEIEILDKTTMEVYHTLLRAKFDKKEARSLRDLMSEMDLVKFAKYIPDNDIIKSHLDFVRSYVINTKKNPEENEKNEL